MDNDTQQDNIFQQNEYVHSKFHKIKSMFEKKRHDTGSSTCDAKSVQECSKKTAKEKKITTLEQFEEYRKKTNFSTLAENFGYYKLLQTSSEKRNNEDLEATLEKLKTNIILKNEGDFQSKLKFFEKKDEKPEEEEAKLSHFIKETNEMCENYEKEIDYLKHQMEDLQKKKNEYEQKWHEISIELSIDHVERNIEILPDPKKFFLNQMSNLKDPSLLEITYIYNEKITELFEENETLNRKIKKFADISEAKVKLEDLVNSMTKTIKEKDDNIRTINEIYQNKFSEVFLENEKLSGEITKLKNVISENEAIIKSYQTEEKRMKELLHKQEESLSNKNTSSSAIPVDHLSSLEEKISSQEKEITKLKEFIMKVQSSSENKEISYVGNNNEALEEVRRYYEKKLSDLKNDCKTFESKAIKFEKRYKFSEGENEQLKDIITKDQLRIRHLMEMKEKYELNKNCETMATLSEFEALKEENELMRVRLSTIDRQKNNDSSNVTMTSSGSISLLSKDFTQNIITEYLYMLYLSEISINAHQIVQIILNNFPLYLSTCFLYDKFNLTFSIMNEFIENILFRVSDECMLKKLSSGLKGKDVWMITEDDVTQDIVKDLCCSFFEENPITTIVSSTREVKSIDEIINSFVHKYESTLDLNMLNEFILSEVKPVLANKVEKFKRLMLTDIQKLIYQCVKNIKAGTIIVNGKEVYNFKNYSKQFASRDLSTRGSMKVNLPAQSVDNLTTGIKSTSLDLKHFYLSGDLYTNNDCDPSLVKLLVSILIHCPKLEGLHVIKSNLTEGREKHAIHLIENLSNLKLLDLSDNNLKDEGLLLFSNVLKIHNSITEIVLSNNNLSENSGLVLAEILIENKKIDKLDIRNNIIKGSGLSSIFTVLINNNCFLKYLDISNNSLSYEDFTNLCEFLKKNPQLSALNISDNALDSQSANLLGTALPQAMHLKILNISRVNLTEKNATLLLHQLNTTKLEEIIINENPLDEAGIIVAADVMKNNQLLKHFQMNGYSISNAAFSCIGNAICQNSVVEVLNLEGDEFDEEGVVMFMGVVKERNIKVIMSSEKIPGKLRESVLLMKCISLR